jgi:hypothetical protein
MSQKKIPGAVKAYRRQIVGRQSAVGMIESGELLSLGVEYLKTCSKRAYIYVMVRTFKRFNFRGRMYYVPIYMLWSGPSAIVHTLSLSMPLLVVRYDLN